MSCFRRLVARLSPHRLEVDTGLVHVRYAVDKVVPGRDFLKILPFSSISIIPPILRAQPYLYITLISKRGQSLSTVPPNKAMLILTSGSTGDSSAFTRGVPSVSVNFLLILLSLFLEAGQFSVSSLCVRHTNILLIIPK